jgi:protein-S-isoprenylcysteine O-methyltransferase Ste14
MPFSASLTRKAFEGLSQFMVASVGLVILPAWSIHYWQGWLFLGVFATCVTIITAYFLRNDPALIQRRLNVGPRAEKEPTQKVIQTLSSVLFVSLIAVSSIDHRFGWSSLPWPASVAGDALVVLGLVIIFFVFRENTYTSAIVEVDKEQRVISSGPYRLVRHPMYSGALLMMAGIPIALGSLWALLIWGVMATVIVWRLVDEENYLIRNLPGYKEYRTVTRYRLVPGLY